MKEFSGKDRLWKWFELNYASFLTLPKVIMHEMPVDNVTNILRF